MLNKPGFYLYSGNKLEKLAELFRREVYTVDPSDPAAWFAPEIVITQTRGIADWLKLELAGKGIAANLQFPFVNSFIESVLKSSAGHAGGSITDKSGMPDAMNIGDMTWELFLLMDQEIYSCTSCGHVQTGKDAPLRCGVCGKAAFEDVLKEAKRYFEKFVCPECGFVHAGNGSPEVCPECGRSVLKKRHDDLRKFQLAEKLAGLYDRYQIYHGDVLHSWRQDKSGCRNWQAVLYRCLADGKRGLDEYFRIFAGDAAGKKIKLPYRRVSVFGVSAMPEAYFKFFLHLSKICEVHFFYLNPCMDYWRDILTPKQAQPLAEHLNIEHGELVNGNQLLAALGVQGRRFFSMISSLSEEDINIYRTAGVPSWCGLAESELPFESYLPEDALPSMLQLLQEDILTNAEFSSGDVRHVVRDDDNSIQIHNCHSPLREVEVLHDVLLDALDSDPGLEPGDIIVMAPDIAGYEPYIRAVFGSGVLRDSYSVCDRAVKTVNHAAAAFLGILELCRSKFRLSEVFELLENPALKVHQALSGDELEKIRRRVSDAGVRWGVDAGQRYEFCGVAFDEYSWKQGLDRLILGYAVLPEDGADEFGEGEDVIIPVDAAEGSAAAGLGEFISFIKLLIETGKSIQRERTLDEWEKLLSSLLDSCLSTDDALYIKNTAVRTAVAELGERAGRLGGRTITFDLLRYILEGKLGDIDSSEPFLCGNITFCSLIPMRSIPMKTVAILGLNDGAFPRRDFTSELNIVPPLKRGIDHSPSLEDRFLFLESILSARKKLLLFYQGRDRQDNSGKPPAVPLGEFMDQLRLTFETESGGVITEIKHKLQAFDPEYFDGRNRELFSYSAENCTAAKVLPGGAAQNSDGGTVPQISGKRRLRERLSALSAEYVMPKVLDLKELEDFFIAPQAVCLEYNAGLVLKDYGKDETADEEPLAVDRLTASALRRRMAEWTIAGRSDAEQYRIMRKSSLLPVGRGGAELFEKLKKDMDFLNTAAGNGGEALKTAALRAVETPLSVQMDGTVLMSALPLTDENTYFYWRAATFKPRDAVRFYLRFLLQAANAGEAAEAVACFMPGSDGGGGVFRLNAMSREAAVRHLRGVLRIFRIGHRRAAEFFPQASYVYASMTDGEAAAERLKAAAGAFDYTFRIDGVETRGGDCGSDAAAAELFEKEDFNDPVFCRRFARLAAVIFGRFFRQNGGDDERI